MKWISCNIKKPEESMVYKVKSIGIYKDVDRAFYNKLTDTWIYDDGIWLPADISLYVTHWYGE